MKIYIITLLYDTNYNFQKKVQCCYFVKWWDDILNFLWWKFMFLLSTCFNYFWKYYILFCRQIYECKKLLCRCCDHYTCVLNQPKGLDREFQNLHQEDQNLQKLAMVSWIPASKKIAVPLLQSQKYQRSALSATTPNKILHIKSIEKSEIRKL